MAINFNRIPSYISKEIEPPKRVVKIGATGKRVKRVQEWLQFHEYGTAIDGQYGPATAACVAAFQASKELKDTGTTNKDTWNALVNPLSKSLEEPEVHCREDASVTVRTIAEQHLASGPIEIGGYNAGPWVRVYCGGNDGPEWAWCAGFVTLIIQQAYFYRELSVPIKGSVSCDSLAAQAKAAGRFVSGKSLKADPSRWSELGDGACLFLLRRTSTDWVHTGIVTGRTMSNEGIVFRTIEGNTNNSGSREGFKAAARTRSLLGSNYDFVRLTEE